MIAFNSYKQIFFVIINVVNLLIAKFKMERRDHRIKQFIH